MAKAEAADKADIPDGMLIPEELARREERLKKIAEAKAKIEARAKERYRSAQQGWHEAKLCGARGQGEGHGQEVDSGKPAPARWNGTLPTDQVNLTDEEGAGSHQL